jgi:hypothetical protein
MRINDDDAEERKIAIRIRRRVKFEKVKNARGTSIYYKLPICFGTIICCSNQFPTEPGGYNHSIPPMMNSDSHYARASEENRRKRGRSARPTFNNLGCPNPSPKGSAVVRLTPSAITAHNVLGLSGSTILLRAERLTFRQFEFWPAMLFLTH